MAVGCPADKVRVEVACRYYGNSGKDSDNHRFLDEFLRFLRKFAAS